jgi:hypothetical protein
LRISYFNVKKVQKVLSKSEIFFSKWLLKNPYFFPDCRSGGIFQKGAMEKIETLKTVFI